MDKAGWELRRLRRGAPKLRTIHERQVGNDLESVVACVEPCYIDPWSGHAVTERGVLIEASMTPNFKQNKSNWMIDMPTLRSWPQLLRAAQIVHVPRVVSLRHFWEWNYYHFWIDVLGKLPLYDSVGIDKSLTLLVGRYVHEQPFAKQTLALGGFASRNWLAPDEQNRLVVSTDEVIYCRTLQPYRSRVEYLLRELKVQPLPGATDRIFLTRRPPSGRLLLNERELLPVLDFHGFRVIDAATMTIAEHIETFSRTRYLVAVHGAGIVNLIFRGDTPLGILELYSPAYPGPGDMERLCRELSHYHDRLVGPTAPKSLDFTIDPDALDVSIRQLLHAG